MSENSANITFSLITPAYNNSEEVAKLLKSAITYARQDPTMEFIVVDDHSKDDSIKRVVEKIGFARYVRLEKNIGPAAARNAGAKMAKNRILIFLDSDVILNDDTLSRVRDKFDKDRSVTIFSGEYDIETANPSLATKFKSLMVHSWCPEEDRVSVFLTRLGAIKKDIFDEFGGFDTSLRTAAVEDYEFGRRLANKGYIIHYDPSVTVKHHFPGFKNQIKLFFHRSFMWIYVFKKYGKFDNTCTTPLAGIGQICGFMALICPLFTLVNTAFVYGASLFFLIFMLTNRRFFRLALRHEGLLFMIIAVPMALIISCSVVLGGIAGLIYYRGVNRAEA